ncbi:MAG: MarR family winged helix-turn-helix transcriptional regulator [Croceibacterium sp.]|jgi:DNA-binding MarR family transcriptional regulator
MSAPANLHDQLTDVRYRAPALGGEKVDYGLLTGLTGFSVKLVWILGHALLSREFGETGITPHRFSVLEVIGSNPGLQQTQLATALALSRPATTLAVDFWEARQCVERRAIPGDRRSFGVFLTPDGERELSRLRGLVSAADIALTADLSERETAELQRLLRKIHR